MVYSAFTAEQAQHANIRRQTAGTQAAARRQQQEAAAGTHAGRQDQAGQLPAADRQTQTT